MFFIFIFCVFNFNSLLLLLQDIYNFLYRIIDSFFIDLKFCTCFVSDDDFSADDSNTDVKDILLTPNNIVYTRTIDYKILIGLGLLVTGTAKVIVNATTL